MTTKSDQIEWINRNQIVTPTDRLMMGRRPKPPAQFARGSTPAMDEDLAALRRRARLASGTPAPVLIPSGVVVRPAPEPTAIVRVPTLKQPRARILPYVVSFAGTFLTLLAASALV